MGKITKTVILGKQAGKYILTGIMTGQEYVEHLRAKDIMVNSRAQRSLVPGVDKETTEDLLDSDRVHQMRRMKDFRRFVGRVLKNLEQSNATEGFFGSVSLVLPEKFENGRLDSRHEMPDGTIVGLLKASTSMGEHAMHIADGQGRIVGLHSLERELILKRTKAKDVIKRLEKKGQSAVKAAEELEDLERKLKRVQRFLSQSSISFVCYVQDVAEDGTLIGLSEEAEKRCYIEGNALNSQASKEDMIKYETYSPLIVDLQSFRDDLDWMSSEWIEEDSKSISASSSKLFTLSALVQAYSWGMVNDNKPLKNLDENLQTTVDERKAFCHEFWTRITRLFEPVWLEETEPGDRTAYLKRVRHAERNVTFQAVFLQALGQLCFEMGEKVEWNENSRMLNRLERLSPDEVEYRAVTKYRLDEDGKTVHALKWNDTWTDLMMKRSAQGFSFNNASENISATKEHLADLIGLEDPIMEDEEEDDWDEVSEDELELEDI